MIIKSYEINNNFNFLKYNYFLLYGENFGLKKELIDNIKLGLRQKEENIEKLILFENEILSNEDNFNDFVYSGSLFSKKKIITIFDATDKIFKKINEVFEKFPENIYLIIFSEILEKKSKIRNFFEKEKKTICIPCYLDSERDLESVAKMELKKNNITLPRESINLLIEKSNSDRNNLRNEIEKIKSYSLNKKNLDLDKIKLLINFAGEYKSDNLINECLCGNIQQYKKIISEMYINAVNQVLILRILSNKIHRLLKIKEQASKSTNNIDVLINNCRPIIFWKEKPLIKKQLSIWNLNDLKIIIDDINNTELLCKKNPQISNSIFFNFFSEICKKANSFS